MALKGSRPSKDAPGVPGRPEMGKIALLQGPPIALYVDSRATLDGLVRPLDRVVQRAAGAREGGGRRCCSAMVRGLIDWQALFAPYVVLYGSTRYEV